MHAKESIDFLREIKEIGLAVTIDKRKMLALLNTQQNKPATLVFGQNLTGSLLFLDFEHPTFHKYCAP